MSGRRIDFKQSVHMPEHVLFRELDGEAVILNLEDESYYGLDSVGTRMWIVLDTSKTIGDAYELLLAEYDVNGDQLQADMIELIQELRDGGLVVVQ